MLSKDRVLATFNRERTNKVPIYHLGFSSKVASFILGYEAYVGGGIQQWREANALWEGEDSHQRYLEKSRRDALELTKRTDQDVVRAEYWRLNQKPTEKLDNYTYRYVNHDGKWRIMRVDPKTEMYQIIAESVPENEITYRDIEEDLSIKEDALKRYAPCEELGEVRSLIDYIGKEYVVRVAGGSIGIPLKEIWLKATVTRPDLVERLLDLQVKYASKRFEVLAQAGIKIVFGGGDLASNKGPLYSPKVFRKLVLPRIFEISEKCHKHGMLFCFASDGNLWPIADDLFRNSGIDGYYEIDRRAGMDLLKLRRRYPKLTLIGNIGSHTLSTKNVKDVVLETLSCLKIAKKMGGIIVGASNYVLPNTPKRNIIAMLETIRKYRLIV